MGTLGPIWDAIRAKVDAGKVVKAMQACAIFCVGNIIDKDRREEVERLLGVSQLVLDGRAGRDQWVIFPERSIEPELIAHDVDYYRKLADYQAREAARESIRATSVYSHMNRVFDALAIKCGADALASVIAAAHAEFWEDEEGYRAAVEQRHDAFNKELAKILA